MKKWLLKPARYRDFQLILQAWRVWLFGAVIGALLATTVYFISPPPYRARVTVLVDQNVEQVIYEDASDQQKYTYLQRETDKLIEVAWQDSTLAVVSSRTGFSIAELRSKNLHLSQAGDGAWHFMADAPDISAASEMATVWAQSFYDVLQNGEPGISPYLEVILTQAEAPLVQRSVSSGIYIFCGSLLGGILLAFILLFIDRREA